MILLWFLQALKQVPWAESPSRGLHPFSFQLDHRTPLQLQMVEPGNSELLNPRYSQQLMVRRSRPWSGVNESGMGFVKKNAWHIFWNIGIDGCRWQQIDSLPLWICNHLKIACNMQHDTNQRKQSGSCIQVEKTNCNLQWFGLTQPWGTEEPSHSLCGTGNHGFTVATYFYCFDFASRTAWPFLGMCGRSAVTCKCKETHAKKYSNSFASDCNVQIKANKPNNMLHSLHAG